MPGGNGNGSAAVRAARPTINVANQDNDALGGGLQAIEIVENTSGLYRCEATFGNWGAKDQDVGYLYFDRSTLDFGKAFVVKIGSDTIFEGRIMGLEADYAETGVRTITVLAEDRFQDLRMTRRTRTFADKSDQDVFQQIASDYNLSTDFSLQGGSHRILAQVNQSDLAFMRERARSIDAELWMTGTTLHAKSRTDRGSDPLRLEYQAGLLEFTALADLASQRTSVTVSGWDVSNKSAIKAESTESAISSEVSGQDSGVGLVQSALGAARKEVLAHTVPLTTDDAQAGADAFMKMSARRFVTGRGVAETTSALRVGATVDLQGLGTLFNGKYSVTEIRHLFDGTRGIRTEFAVERPGLGRA